MTLATVLSEEASIVGVEPERLWREEAGERLRVVEGVAEALPFEDASFDLVTCQTVLIHLADPMLAVEEMVRVARPGGRVLVVEPNNAASLLVHSNAASDAPLHDTLDLLRLGLTCERGKRLLGEGDNSVGDLVPGMLADAGLEDVETYICDKASALVPPYDTAEAHALADSLRRAAKEERWLWPRDEALRLFRAGGGDDADFDRLYGIGVERARREAELVEEGRYTSAGGVIAYVVSGRRAG
jgi:SAM-dependent methyltransferase